MRAHIRVSTSITSRTRSSVVSPSLDDHDPAALGHQRGLQMLRPEPSQPIPMLHNNHRGRRVCDIRANWGTRHPSPHHTRPPDVEPLGPSPSRWPGYLPIQIGALIVAGYPCIQQHTLLTRRLGNIDQDRARRQTAKRHRHPDPHTLTHTPSADAHRPTAPTPPTTQQQAKSTNIIYIHARVREQLHPGRLPGGRGTVKFDGVEKLTHRHAQASRCG